MKVLGSEKVYNYVNIKLRRRVMRRYVVSIILICLAVPLLSALVLADGGMFISESSWKKHREWSMINEPEQKAVVYFSKGQEQLIISPSYQGPASDFAWVVPVPARPKVEILKGAIFHELANITNPVGMVDGRTELYKSPSKVQVLERKTVGAYDVSVLSATDGKALINWLKTNKYHVPNKALKPINSYVKKKWTFVACRVKVPAISKGLQTGTLAPLRLTFPTKNPVYPMKLSSVNPKTFKVLIYVILPDGEVRRNTTSIKKLTQPSKIGSAVTYHRTDVPWNQKNYKTLAKLSHSALKIFVEEIHLSPKNCTNDFVWDAQLYKASNYPQIEF